MKKLLLFFLLGLNGISLQSQNSWFETDAVWTYQYSSMIVNGIDQLTVTNEEVQINNQTYRKLQATAIYLNFQNQSLDTVNHEERYVYEENNRVFTFENGSVKKLYDFNLLVGDTLDFMYFGGFSPYHFIIDSIGTLEINGVTLAFQDIRIENYENTSDLVYWMRVIETIGSINTYFFWNETVIQPTDFPQYEFRCYEDQTLGLTNLSIGQVDCDYIPGLTSLNDLLDREIEVFPNPTSDFIQVQGEGYFDIEIVDLQGRLILDLWQIRESTLIDLSTFQDGVYFLKMKKGNRVITKRVVKN